MPSSADVVSVLSAGTAVASSSPSIVVGPIAPSSEEERAAADRLIGLVEFARGGDREAFGELYAHYRAGVLRFLSRRLSSDALAEDLTEETFFRALRAIDSFRWSGNDFAAWLTTIARNLATDHFKAAHTRSEFCTYDARVLDSSTENAECKALADLTHVRLIAAVAELPTEQHDCVVMRFLGGLSLSETAVRLDRTIGATKQLQLRGLRNLAKVLQGEEP